MAATKANTPTKSDEKTAKPAAPVAITINGRELIAIPGEKKGIFVANVPLKWIKVEEGFNPRKGIPKDKVEELAASIKKNGLLNNPTVRPSEEEGTFYVVAGERRFRALKLLEWETIPVKIRVDLQGKDKTLDAKVAAVAENAEDTRTNLSPLELGHAFQEFTKAGMSMAQIASETGVGKTTVQRCMSLVGLAPEYQKIVEKDPTKARAVAALAALPAEEQAGVRAALTNDQLTEDAVRTTAKKLAKESEAVVVNAGTKGKASKKASALVVWRGNRAAGEVLTNLAVEFDKATKHPEQMGSCEWYEMRGALAVLFHLRTDLDSTTLPPVDATDAASVKILAGFNKLIDAEVAKHAKANPATAAEAAAAAPAPEAKAEKKGGAKKSPAEQAG